MLASQIGLRLLALLAWLSETFPLLGALCAPFLRPGLARASRALGRIAFLIALNRAAPPPRRRAPALLNAPPGFRRRRFNADALLRVAGANRGCLARRAQILLNYLDQIEAHVARFSRLLARGFPARLVMVCAPAQAPMRASAHALCAFADTS